ncbi:hypothetical protein TNCV_4355741 [Trichonephila clavipes]|nr:hypothetical protein TNCV_4355741 [Trichonephila clavipes]
MFIYSLILTYASPIWGHAAKAHINYLESAQSLNARQILNVLWFMRNVDLRAESKTSTIRQTIRRNVGLDMCPVTSPPPITWSGAVTPRKECPTEGHMGNDADGR